MQIGELDLYGGHCGLADRLPLPHCAGASSSRARRGQARSLGLGRLSDLRLHRTRRLTAATPRRRRGHNHGSWSYRSARSAVRRQARRVPICRLRFTGTVVNYGGQVDGQPEVQSLRQSGTGGYTAQAVQGARIVAFKNPVVWKPTARVSRPARSPGTPSADQFLMRVPVGTATYDECWRDQSRVQSEDDGGRVAICRASAPTTTTYNNGGNRLTAYAIGFTQSAEIAPTPGRPSMRRPRWVKYSRLHDQMRRLLQIMATGQSPTGLPGSCGRRSIKESRPG